METSIVFNPWIHPPICLSRMSDVTVPPWISAFGSSLTLGPSVAPQLDHHSHGIQNNMSQQRTCHVHDHMSLSRPHVIFTTTCRGIHGPVPVLRRGLWNRFKNVTLKPRMATQTNFPDTVGCTGIPGPGPVIRRGLWRWHVEVAAQ